MKKSAISPPHACAIPSRGHQTQWRHTSRCTSEDQVTAIQCSVVGKHMTWTCKKRLRATLSCLISRFSTSWAVFDKARKRNLDGQAGHLTRRDMPDH
eukprot:3149658-Amphidinium_carterae.1